MVAKGQRQKFREIHYLKFVLMSSLRQPKKIFVQFFFNLTCLEHAFEMGTLAWKSSQILAPCQ